MKKYRLINKSRFITVISILLFIIIALLSHSKADVQTKYYYFEDYVISEGNTLWKVARESKSKTNSKKDVREIIYLIENDNDIQDCGSIQPGQVIKIRSEY